jgi:hypothetical protein
MPISVYSGQSTFSINIFLYKNPERKAVRNPLRLPWEIEGYVIATLLRADWLARSGRTPV